MPKTTTMGSRAKALRTEVVSTPSKGEEDAMRGKRRRRSGEEKQEEEEQEEESVAKKQATRAGEGEMTTREPKTKKSTTSQQQEKTTAPSSPVSPPAASAAVSSKNRRFVGDIKLHASLVSLVERRATPRKKQLIMTTFDERSYVFALHHALNVERVLRESEFSEDDDKKKKK